MAPLAIDHITLPAFTEYLSRYASLVPDKLDDLDALRYDSIPGLLANRKQNDDAFLKPWEVLKLVEWKLKHGTFRPKLLSLVQSNEDWIIEDVTREAYAKFSETANAHDAVGLLTGLQGIGPATASLLLSVYALDEVPFFSDELFRWCMWDEGGSDQGWKRKIKYNTKEYRALVERVGRMRERLGVKAVDAERVAWVLGKSGVDVEADEGEAEVEELDAKEEADNEDRAEKEEEEKKETETKVSKQENQEAETKKPRKTKGKTKDITPPKSVKRKAEDVKAPTEGMRRSSRRKTAS